jgi:hypothetical protein
MRKVHRIAGAALLIGLLTLAVEAEARGGRGGGFGGGGFGGGGFRGGGSMSMSRGGSFNSGTFSRGGSYSRPGGDFSRPGQGGSGTQINGGNLKPSTRPGQGGSGTQLPANRPGGGGSGTEWRPGNRPDNGCPGCGGSGTAGWIDHPIAAGIAIGAVAGMTAAAIGSTYYALPPDCSPYAYDAYTYYNCGEAWYQPQYEGDTVVYVTVPDPKAAPPPQ